MTPSHAAVLGALYKKFVWADALRRKYDQAYARDGEFIGTAPEEGKIRSFEEAFEADMYLCLWYSMLYVAVEGWPTAREKNEKLKVLLRSKNKGLLKDFRDATLHPSDWRDDRLFALIAKGKESYDWAVALTDAFRDFFEPIADLDRQSRRKTAEGDGLTNR